MSLYQSHVSLSFVNHELESNHFPSAVSVLGLPEIWKCLFLLEIGKTVLLRWQILRSVSNYPDLLCWGSTLFFFFPFFMKDPDVCISLRDIAHIWAFMVCSTNSFAWLLVISFAENFRALCTGMWFILTSSLTAFCLVHQELLRRVCWGHLN